MGSVRLSMSGADGSDVAPPGKRMRTSSPDAAPAEAPADAEPKLNSGRNYSGHVRDKDVPVSGKLSLVQFLSVRYSHHNEAEWRHMISAGAVSVGPNTGDGEIQIAPDSAVKAHQRVVYRRVPWVEPPVPGTDQLNVLFEDE